MKKIKLSYKKIFPTLASSINALVANKEIAFPYLIICFIQLLTLELLNCVHRFPFDLFFAPIIRKFFGEIYLHYPFNFTLLPKLFQPVEIALYIFISIYFIAVSILAVVELNSGKKVVHFGSLMKRVLSSYISLILAALLIFGTIILFFKLFGQVYNRAILIQASSGIKFIVKAVIIYGAPFIYLSLNAFATVLFAYVVPVIIIDKKKIFSAIWINFKILFSSPWFTFCVVAIPYLFLIPMLILKQINFLGGIFPEIKFWFLVIDIIIMVAIDAVVYTALTIFYLLKREDK